MNRCIKLSTLIVMCVIQLFGYIPKRYVTTTGAGARNGSSWDNAYEGLQAALNDATSGNQIWVKAGTYTPTVEAGGTGERYKTFQMKAGVEIYGGFAGTESSVSERNNYGPGEANETILSGDIGTPNDSTDNCYHVFYHPAVLGLTSSAVLNGFTIKGGNANHPDVEIHMYGGGMYNSSSSPTLAFCTFTSNASNGGGGIYDSSSSPTLTNCTFTSNSASGAWGGGMYNSYSSSPTLNSCTFSSNSASVGGGVANEQSSPSLNSCTFTSNSGVGGGGGVANYSSSSPTLTDCIFTENTTSNYGGGIDNASSSPTLSSCTFSSNSAGYGGGIGNESSSSPALTNCTFSTNSATLWGGGMYNEGGSPLPTNCTFTSNTALHGAGMYNNGSSSTLTNCRFTSNSAAGNGGGLYNNYSSETFINCTFTQNSASDGGGGMMNDGATTTLNNCIVWGNQGGSNGDEFLDVNGSIVTLNYSCYANETGDVYLMNEFETFTATNNNITTDPQFAGGSNPAHPYSLLATSPCLDAGLDSYNSESNDIRGSGHARKLNKTTGAAGTIDMGAYEYDASEPLPVELASFTATAKQNRVELKWKTATEKNNYGFEIEKSVVSSQTSVNRWEKIGFVQGNGTTNSPKSYSFVDARLNDVVGQASAQGKVSYRLKQIDRDGKFAYSQTVEVMISQKPQMFALMQNYPNPFNPSTMISYQLPMNSHVNLKVYDAVGREVATLVNEVKEAGNYTVQLSMNNYQLSSGVYFYKLTAGKFTAVKKLTLMK